MKFSIIVITFCIYFPIFIRPFLYKAGISILNPSLYSILLLLIVNFFIFFEPTQNKPRFIQLWLKNMLCRNFVVFNILVVVLLSLKGIYGQNLITPYRIAIPFVVSLLICLFVFIRHSYATFNIFFNKIALIAGIFLILQTGISLFESLDGEFIVPPLATSLSQIQSGNIAQRDFLYIFGVSFRDVGLKKVFLGLLDQHNFFGSMLVFYNLMFLICFHQTGKKIYIIFSGIVLLAVLANTTRFAIISILISDLLIMLNRSKRNKIFVGATLLFSLPLLIANLYQSFKEYFLYTNTIASRLDLWQFIIAETIDHMNILELIFGVDINDFLLIAFTHHGGLSYENAFLWLFMLTGSFGLAIFVYVFYINPMFRILDPCTRHKTCYLITTLSCLIISLVAETIFNISSYLILSLCILKYCSMYSEPTDTNSKRLTRPARSFSIHCSRSLD